MPSFLTAIVLPLLCGLLLRPLTANEGFKHTSFPDAASRALLLTAHPDDEAMFFAPTILSLTSRRDQEAQQSPEIFSLCLSTGNAEGLGDTRRGELAESLRILGVPVGNQRIVDHLALPDNMTALWDPKVIAEIAVPFIEEHQIDTILTFDREGISSHANHISLPYAVRSIVTTSARPLRMFMLVTVPQILKYSGPLSAIIAKIDIYTLRAGALPVFVSGWREWLAAVNAMRQHESQLVWFRWLYVAASRYMWVNEWVEVVVPVAQE